MYSNFLLLCHLQLTNSVMDEASRVQLEALWQNIDARYSYSEWEKKRQEDWQRIITQRLPELGRNVDVDSGLFSYMQSRAVFDRRTIETFKVFDSCNA